MIAREALPVAFVTGSVTRRAGGVFPALRSLAQTLHVEQGVRGTTLGARDAFVEEDLPSWAPVEARALPSYGPRTFAYAHGMPRVLVERDVQLVHTHGLWMHASWSVQRWARRTGRPYVISPHGNLNAWALELSRWKKRLATLVYERAHLHGAACLHALCEAEAEAIRNYGLTGPICIIPNGVSLPSEKSRTAPPWQDKIPAAAKVLLFCGRLHPSKGLAELLHAWARAKELDPVPSDPWHLAVVGWSQDGEQEHRLAQLAGELGIAATVHLLGPAFGEVKAAAFEAAEAFILPSFTEGLPMGILEAWSHRLPVLMTRACHLPEGYAAGAAIEIETECQPLAEKLLALFRLSPAERLAMGQRGRTLVESRFTWSRVAAQMRAVYDWVLRRAPRPECIWNG